MSTKNIIIDVQNVGLTIKNKIILSDINFQLRQGEIVTIIGPNGAGKSSLLSVILGIQKSSKGKVIMKPDLKIGFVPQNINEDHSLPLTVKDFTQLTKNKTNKDEFEQIINEMNIKLLQDKFLYNLSGGELRRVLFARALMNKPELLVLDEPTAGVDVKGQIEFYEKINQLRQDYGFSILMVSHDLHLVMSATDYVICLNSHICCAGKPSLVANDPSYLSLFGDKSSELAFYTHHHNHSH